jgi:ribosomal protein L37AE/L43A
MVDIEENVDADHTCAICGRHLSSNSRSVNQPDLCKECAGEQDDAVVDEFK